VGKTGWVIRGYRIDDGSLVFHRPCASADSARTWARYWTRSILRVYPLGVRCVIFDPADKPYQQARVTQTSHPLRLRWEPAEVPS
jgi:hypothetical protein